jgi:Arc/MetJ family transcription regulator
VALFARRGKPGPDEALKIASLDAIFDGNEEFHMRTTVALDDQLLEKARALTGLTETSALLRESLKAIIERESALRLARLGGSEPDATAPPRRRSKSS